MVVPLVQPNEAKNSFSTNYMRAARNRGAFAVMAITASHRAFAHIGDRHVHLRALAASPPRPGLLLPRESYSVGLRSGRSGQGACIAPSQHDMWTSCQPKSGAKAMKRVLATAAVGAALLAAASSEASAWVCLAAGAGSSGYARDPYDVQDAKIIALRTCEGRSPFRSARSCGAGRECGRRATHQDCIMPISRLSCVQVPICVWRLALKS